MPENDPKTLLLTALASVGLQDLYTDAREYSGRVEAMWALLGLAQRLPAGQPVTLNEIEAAWDLENADVVS
jgi:hypothetical protein